MPKYYVGSPCLLAKSSRYILGISNMGALNPLYLGHLQEGCSEALINRAFQGCLPGNAQSTRASGHIFSPIRSLRSAQKPLRRSRRRGAAWREQGLDCLSAASYQARRQAARDKGFSAPRGRLSLLTFFGEIKKEGRKVSGARCCSAQRH